MGTGFTGRNVMGMPPITLKTMREHVEVIRGLLAGKEATIARGRRERAIRFLHTELGYINVADQIPIYMASNGPKALRMAGEIADGWVTIGLDPAMLSDSIKQIKASAAAVGRNRARYTPPT